ncbi:little elongation complex subunit 2-like [Liolophura sinensis]|uniref:little elongation complex subunit 2-like n=1 Tax=Liolophura sinensis TaxID=3198878 RepID=UPI003158358C
MAVRLRSASLCQRAKDMSTDRGRNWLMRKHQVCRRQGSCVRKQPVWRTRGNLAKPRGAEAIPGALHSLPQLSSAPSHGGERIEMNILKELHTTVSCEQEEFQNYLRHLAECNVSSYNFLQPAAKTYIQEKISHACKRVRQYPRFYETIDAVSLTVPVEQKEFPPLVYVRPLLELGQVPKVILPNMSCGAKPVLPTDHDKVSEHCPPAGRKTTASNTWNKQACSQDWNAEVLAQKYGCQIVLSSGGLKCLLDNQSPGYQRDWQLPVIVKEYPVVDNGKTFLHKVVYIDKPLVNQKMTVREKNSKFHKAALKTLVCNILKSHRLGSKRSEVIGEIKPMINVKKEKGKTKSSNQSVCKKTNSSKVSDDFFSSGDIEMDSLETFGMSAGLTRQSKKTDTKMAEDDGIKPKSADVTKMSSHEISTEFTAEPVVKVEVDNITTDNIATGKVIT